MVSRATVKSLGMAGHFGEQYFAHKDEVAAWISGIKYLDVGPQAQLPPPYAEDISALLTMALS